MPAVNFGIPEIKKSIDCLTWLPSYGWQRLTRPSGQRPRHVILAVADHFEPGFTNLPEQRKRIERWCHEFRNTVASWPDGDGKMFSHTFFYPAEQYNAMLMEPLFHHCHDGWGEIEIQLHHGIDHRDTSGNTRATLARFRDVLAEHGCLSRVGDNDSPRYAFVHGNWALANSNDNQFCGVDDEMQVLADTGCYADFTLPSAPDGPQISKINALYECALPLNHQAPHRRGRDLRLGVDPKRLPLIVQGPLGVRFASRNGGWQFPRIENGEISRANPPTLQRFRFWSDASITVRGRPEWVFIKLHCHGLDPGEETVMFGAELARFLGELSRWASQGDNCGVHYVTAREMVNIILAGCAGEDGNPGDYRDYQFKLLR